MSLSRPCDNYISISLLQGLVNTFLKLFSLPLYRSPSRDNSIILSSSLTIVNYFFKLFRFFKLTSLARQLNYSIKSYPSLSSSFSCFFHFFIFNDPVNRLELKNQSVIAKIIFCDNSINSGYVLTFL